MLYETASRATAVLELNVEDCDFDNPRAKVTVKGGKRGWLTALTSTNDLRLRLVTRSLAAPRRLHAAVAVGWGSGGVGSGSGGRGPRR